MEDIKNDITYEGTLYINPNAGTVTFMTDEGVRILRVTHLPAPVPEHINIDLVAIRNITSYTPLPLQPGDLKMETIDIDKYDTDRPERIAAISEARHPMRCSTCGHILGRHGPGPGGVPGRPCPECPGQICTNPMAKTVLDIANPTHIESFQEWRDEDIYPVPPSELGPE